MTKMVLSEAALVGVAHVSKGGKMRSQVRVTAVLSSAEQKRLHISLNGFKAVELDQEFEAVELRFIPPDALKAHVLSISADRAAKFKVREHEGKEGKPERQILEFTAYSEGSQLEVLDFMAKLGDQGCRLELAERQQELFEASEPRKRGRPRKDAAAGEEDDE